MKKPIGQMEAARVAKGAQPSAAAPPKQPPLDGNRKRGGEAPKPTDTFIPRAYQLEIVEMAKISNIVAYLDTGAGKTFISVLLLRHRLEAHLAAAEAAREAGEDRSASLPWKSVFLAPQVALVEQQAAVLARHLPARVQKFVGVDIERWNSDIYVSNWRKALGDLDVLVATPQIVVDMLSRAVVPGLHVFDLIVFDEAHHCKGGHPYNRIMDWYRQCKEDRRPRIFGMSAAPAGAGASKFHRLSASLMQLQTNMDSKVVTVADRTSLEEVVPQPELEVVRYPPHILLAVPDLASLESAIEHAIARLEIAVAIAHLRWNAGLEVAIGWSASADAFFAAFEPGAPRFKVARMKDAMRSILHVLQNVGAYGAACSTLDALKWLSAGAPDPRSDPYENTCRATKSATGCQGAKTSPPGAAASTPWAPAGGSTTRQVGQYADLRVQAEAAGIEWAEVDEINRTSWLSTLDLIRAFVALFCGLHGAGGAGGGGTSAAAAATAALADAEACLARNRPLGHLPLRVMDAVLRTVRARDLEFSLAASAAKASDHHRQRFSFPLVAPKVATLVEVLQRYRTAATAANAPQQRWSGIVFAQQRLAVMALGSLLKELAECGAAEGLAVHPFMAQGSAFGAMKFMPEDQAAILRRFKMGDLNLLISTSVAEEGIDVKTCQLVVRFDPAPTAQAFHQSRGRARAAGSHLVALVEAGNEVQEAAVQRMAEYQHMMRRAALDNVAGLGEAVGAEGEEAESYSAEDDEMGEEDGPEWAAEGEGRVYRVPATGAVVSLHSAAEVLQHYVAQLPSDAYMLLRPVWILDFMDAEGRSVRATVRLPSSSPVQTATGKVVPTKRLAKATAALEACRQLHQVGALNDHLLPAALVQDEEEEDEYGAGGEEEEEAEEGEVVEGKKRRKKGLTSVEVRSTPPTALCLPLPQYSEGPDAAALQLHGYGWKKLNGKTEWLPIVLLLPQPLQRCTDLPPAVGQFGEEWSSATPLGVFSVEPSQVKAMLGCSSAMRSAAGPWCALLPSSASDDSENGEPAAEYHAFKATYALAPLLLAPEPRELDWAMIQRVGEAASLPTDQNSALHLLRTLGCAGLDNSVLITSYNKMQYVFVSVLHDLKVSSPFPLDREAPPSSSSSSRTCALIAAMPDGATYADYYAHRWGRSGLDLDQPLLLASKSSRSVLRGSSIGGAAAVGADHLPPDADSTENRDRVMLVPELCTVHPIPRNLWPALATVPWLIWELEGGLHACEVVDQLVTAGLPSSACPPLGLIRQALTAPSAKHNVGNYETLETLGDGLLKFAASAQLFFERPTWHEGQLTSSKDRMVSNSRLVRVALVLGLETRVRVDNWAQTRHNQREAVEGEAGDMPRVARAIRTRVRNSKLLADVVEALIGSFLLGCGRPAALCLLRHIGVAQVPFNTLPDYTVPPADGFHPMVDIEAVEDAIGYKFRCPWLLQEALTHGSVLGKKCYQRLEFVGDAIIDYVVAQYAYKSRANPTPAQLHDIRSSTVNMERLAMTAVRCRLHTHLLYHSPVLFAQIDDYVTEAEAVVDAIRKRYGLRSTSDAWDEVMLRYSFGLDQCSPPKVLSDVVESVMGAVWLDAGGSMETAWEVVEGLFSPLPWLNGGRVPLNPLRIIYEIGGRCGYITEFRVIETDQDVEMARASGARVAVNVYMGETCLGSGPPAHNKNRASRLAAQAVMSRMSEGEIVRMVQRKKNEERRYKK